MTVTDFRSRFFSALRAFEDSLTVNFSEPLPALAAWLATRASPVMATWRNRQRRAAIEQQLQPLSAAGFLAPMLQLLDDPKARSARPQDFYDGSVITELEQEGFFNQVWR